MDRCGIGLDDKQGTDFFFSQCAISSRSKSSNPSSPGCRFVLGGIPEGTLDFFVFLGFALPVQSAVQHFGFSQGSS
tara:strand:- start:175 stop:402 length:228 start_codon:yes stop_codon:yes gene_type:complete